MGLFSSIGKIFKAVAPALNTFLGSPLGQIGTSAVSGLFASRGAQQQNLANIASGREAAAFNAEQAELSRNFASGESLAQRQWANKQGRKSRRFNAWSADRNRAFNKGEARTTRKWTEMMSSSAHQRQMADMRKAGLNPILSGRYGGAASPPGATASGQAASSSPPSGSAASSTSASRTPAAIIDEITPALNTAMQAFQLKNNVAQTRATTRNIDQQNTNLRAELENIKARYEEITTHSGLYLRQQDESDAKKRSLNARELNVDQDTRNKITQRKSVQQLIKANVEKLKGLKNEGKIDETTYGYIVRMLMRMNPFASSAKAISTIGR